MIASTDNARIPLSPGKCRSLGPPVCASARLSTPAITLNPLVPGPTPDPPQVRLGHSYPVRERPANSRMIPAAWLNERWASAERPLPLTTRLRPAFQRDESGSARPDYDIGSGTDDRVQRTKRTELTAKFWSHADRDRRPKRSGPSRMRSRRDTAGGGMPPPSPRAVAKRLQQRGHSPRVR
jgi:hypothetical protein